MNQHSINILILDDQELVSAGMRELLKISEPAATIFEAYSFAEAIRFFESEVFHFAFLDIDLRSEYSGLDVLKYIREHDLETRAIMLSGCPEQSIVLDCINAGACGYISKSYSSNNIFREALDMILNGGIYIPQQLGDNTLEGAKFSPIPVCTPESFGIKGRQIEVLTYLCQGLSNKMISRKTNLSEGTIRKDYLPKIFRVFKVSRRTELMLEIAKLRIQLPILKN